MINLIFKLKWYFIVLLVLLLFSTGADFFIKDRSYGSADTEKFQQTFLKKEQKLREGLSFFSEKLDQKGDSISAFSLFDNTNYRLFEDEGLAFFYYVEDKLHFWTDNKIPVPNLINNYPQFNIVSFGNSTFYIQNISNDRGALFGLLHIKTNFPYENQLLDKGFRKEFKMLDQVELIENISQLDHAIYNKKGEYLFSLDYSQAFQSNNIANIIIVIFYFLTFAAFLILIRRLVHLSPKNIRNYVAFISIALIFILYKLFTFIRFPAVLFQSEAFMSFEIQNLSILSSIAEVSFFVFLLFYSIYTIYIDFHFSPQKLKKPQYRFAVSFIFIIVALLTYVINGVIIKLLILSSNISFETYKVLDLSANTFIGFGIFALLFASFTLLIDKVLSVYDFSGHKYSANLFTAGTVLLVLFISLLPWSSYLSAELMIFYILVCLIIYYLRIVSKSKYKLSSFVVYVLLFSLFTLFEVNRYSEEKNIAEMKMMAVDLSTEHDPVAEILFMDVEKNLREDLVIENFLYSANFDIDRLYNIVERKYFRGFWDKYEMQITVCGGRDSVYVEPPDDKWYNCYPFFYENILEYGIKVSGSEIYYLDNLNGRISYLLPVIYRNGEEDEVSLFIELDSRLVLEGLGYPDLLLDESVQSKKLDYSYAKYNDNQLITSVGNFDYSMRSDVYSEVSEGFEEFSFDKFDHIAYHLDNNNTIIVSKPSVFWVDLLISFSYIFSFYFLSLFILLLISQISPVRLHWALNFKTKIQWGMNSILFFSFLLIGIGTVYFSINQYKNKQYEILEEKVQSVYVELIHKLEFESDLKDWSSGSYYSLHELLLKFSNVFYSDINLYDSEGQLLASSRPEIFRMGLLSKHMDAHAFEEMSVKMRSEFVQSELIGRLNYLSAYVPFVNADNQLLAYLNLPYFSRQDALTREITNLVVAIINIVVLLSLLSFIMAAFMANTIAMPLKLLQQKFAHISLSEKNEIIEYEGKDEIGSLVIEYNQMVNKLQDSVELLAKSERESAWREMAKQIAHEIKNPLTPMKLHIQHLQRTLEENPENTVKHVKSISNTLIEQIDNLSSIATEFSNFAKMPQAKSEIFDLETKLRNSIDLFNDYERCILSLKMDSREPLFVFADKEQIYRVFINLIKNAIQAVPENAVGMIEVKLEKRNEKAVVSIKDNGKGIPDDIRGKLFQPNFTTKTSGMGLGLAIVKNIIQDAGGDIYFETEPGVGSVFYVELPLVKKQD